MIRIQLDRKSTTPLYLQIRNQVRQLILSHGLAPGHRLPPERRLAEMLSVNRSTVVNAYRELEADGLIESHVGRGTTVKNNSSPDKHDYFGVAVQPLSWKHFFSRQSSRMNNPLLSNVMDLVTRNDIISFTVGAPSRELYPVKEIEYIISHLNRVNGQNLLEYGSTAGLYQLREGLSAHMARRGVEAGPENIVVLSGSQQGLDLAARVLLEPGDVVVVEEPCYLGALQIFGASGARVLSIPLDVEGLRTDILEQVLARCRPKFIYTLPTYQNPSGVTMSVSRRRDLLKLAYSYNVPVLEDDPYSELYYDSEPAPLLKAMDVHDHVIYLSTFSKILFPGLRLGWMAAPAVLARQLAMAKQLTDLHTNTMSQWIIDEFCRRGLLDGHLKKIRGEYAARRDAMLSALAEHAPPGLRWNRPAGGFYIWCELPGGVSAGLLLSRAAARKVAFLPGDAFYNNGGGADRIRLSFSRGTKQEIREGVRIICECLGELGAARPVQLTLASEAGPLV